MDVHSATIDLDILECGLEIVEYFARCRVHSILKIGFGLSVHDRSQKPAKMLGVTTPVPYGTI